MRARDERWPAWATAPVDVVAPDPGWADRADQLRADLDALLEPWLAGPIEHVGSTAVPDLPAKPVVDLMAPVVSLDEAAAADPALQQAGWSLVPPELDGRPWRRFHVLPQHDTRSAHLHLVEPTHPRWSQTLAFRDVLRADPGLRAAYATLKIELAAEHRDDREGYTAAKTAFIDAVLARAV